MLRRREAALAAVGKREPGDLRVTRVAVTGAGGFIGGRLVEVLAHARDTEVRGLLRLGSNAARAARHGNVELLFGVLPFANSSRDKSIRLRTCSRTK